MIEAHVDVYTGQGVRLQSVQGNGCIHYILTGAGIAPQADIWKGTLEDLADMILAPMGLRLTDGAIVAHVEPTYQTTLDAFLTSGREFEEAVMSSTTAGFSGGGYCLELFPDGTRRVLWSDQIGNGYRTPGIILPIPQHDQDTLNDIERYGSDADLSVALDQIAQTMRDYLAESL